VPGQEVTVNVRSNADWVVNVGNGTMLESYTATGTASTTGTPFTFKVAANGYGATTVTFSPATPGLFPPVVYTLESMSFIPVVSRFAKSNVVLKLDENGDPALDEHGNRLLTFAIDNNDEIPANVVGLKFAGGSLIGCDPSASTTPWSARMVFIPEEFTGTMPTSHNDLPRKTAYEYTLDGLKTNPSSARGDICVYMSDKGMIPGRWHVPTRAEINSLAYETIYADKTRQAYQLGVITTDAIPAFSYGYFQSTQCVGYGYNMPLSTMETQTTGSVVLPNGLNFDMNTYNLSAANTSGISVEASWGVSWIEGFLTNGELDYSNRTYVNVRCIKDI
jgi:hypothetical protein